MHRGHGERDETLHATREPPAVLVQPLADVQGIDEPGAAGAYVDRGRAADPADELDRLARREAVDRKRGLGLDRAGPSGEPGIGHDIVSADGDAAGVGLEEPHHLVDERRLAGAVVAEQAVDLAGLHGERDPVVRAGSLPVGLGQAIDLQQHHSTLVRQSGRAPRFRYRTVSRYQSVCQCA